MDWTAGYASDIEYTTGFYREQSPAWMNLVCLLNGIEPLPLDKPYTYCELGFGRGLTSQLLAASNPHASFYAADFNPAQVAEARQFTEQSGIGNLNLLENSFEELANGKVELPQFDYITLHGIYTWVTAENRANIVRFIGRYLKPGGLVYLSYNAMPGWTQTIPLQRMLVEFADQHPGRSDVQIKGATEFINRMEAADAAYLTQNPGLKVRMDSLKTASPHYLVHEYMHKHWQPLFHADVARDLAEAKMSYAGSADLAFAYPELFVNEKRLNLILEATDPALQETIKDYLLNTAFRRDVFVRGARRMNQLRQAELLGQVTLALSTPRDKVNLKMVMPFGEVTARSDLYNVIFDALSERDLTLAQLCTLPAISGLTIQAAGQIASLLCASGQAVFYFNPEQARDVAPARRLNANLAAQSRYGEDYAALCSPLLGAGLSANYFERLFYMAMQEAPSDPTPGILAQRAWAIMSTSPRRIKMNGEALQSPEENQKALELHAEQFLKATLPYWQRLQIL
ncbi:methyltransferase domain-containing protein [Pseudoduganella sp. FT93W]|uniref:Methyltransferase domain-containing protein n=1 Tax=Duganella fentianensis TaxID=2692177 RepID=A0A845HUX4_9BURK|nr:class I SAM-dependent methyltransferase [Duganella fentianensis]MYN44829.1 methyltransferase domain-containing protein [Duganella fentianensis]